MIQKDKDIQVELRKGQAEKVKAQWRHRKLEKEGAESKQ